MKKILIVIPSFAVGGTNSALYNMLLNTHTKSAIDILSISSEGEFVDKFKDFNIIPTPKLLDYWFAPYAKVRKRSPIMVALLRIIKKICQKVPCLNIENKILKYVSKQISLEEYGKVIAFQEGYATDFVSQIDAKENIAWIHCNLKFSDYNFHHLRKVYQKFEKIVCVSESAKKTFNLICPEKSDNSQVIYNLIDKDLVKTLAREECEAGLFVSGVPTIVSVGRLDPVKQFHLIPQIAQSLCENNLRFQWLIIGSGSKEYADLIKHNVEKFNVNRSVKLLGYKENPYKYISRSDLYVCTSLSEACPMVFLEANMLNKYIITTDFESAHELLTNESGSICDISEISSQIEYYFANRLIKPKTNIALFKRTREELSLLLS